MTLMSNVNCYSLPSAKSLLQHKISDQCQFIIYMIKSCGIKNPVVQDRIKSFASQLVIGFYVDDLSCFEWRYFSRSYVNRRYFALSRLLVMNINFDYLATFSFLMENIVELPCMWGSSFLASVI